MNIELINQGLTLSFFGLLFTFMSLGLFILSIFVLRWLFPVEKRTKKETLAVVDNTPTPAVQNSSTTDEEVAAAITAAMSVKQFLSSRSASLEESAAAVTAAMLIQQRLPGSVRRQGLGARLEEPRGRWWQPINNSSNDSLSGMQ